LKTKKREPKGCRFFYPQKSKAYRNRKIPIKRAKRKLVYFSEREEFMQTRREFLTVEELNTLAATPCERPELKNAALFSALTGLRHCDIQKMQWREISMDGNQARLHFTQQKTKGVEYMPISPQALELCGEPQKPNQLVFESCV
jgi:integrase